MIQIFQYGPYYKKGERRAISTISRITVLFVILLIGLLSLVVSAVAQVDTVWTGIYRGSRNSDWCLKVIQTADSGFMMGGVYWTDSTAEDFFLVKTDSNGRQQWSRVYSYHFHDVFYSVAQTRDHGYVMSGYVDQGAASGWLAKVDSIGEPIWQYGYGEAGEFYSVYVDTSDYIYAAGSDGHGWFMKLDAEGNVILERHYGGRGGDVLKRVLFLPDGGYLFVGSSSSYGAGFQGYVVRADSSGEEIWHQTYGGPNIDGLGPAIALPNGHYVLGGGSEQNDGYIQFWVIEINSSGEVVWSHTYPHRGDNYLNDLLLAPDGGYLIVGEYTADRPNGYDYTGIKVNSQGEFLWNLDIGPQNDARFKSGISMPDGSYILAGEERVPIYSQEFWLVRTTPDTSRGNSVHLLDPAFPSLFVLNAPYPNPFNAVTKITYSLPISSEVRLDILDISGRKVTQLVEESMGAGSHTILWDARDVHSGSYFCRLTAGGYSRSVGLTVIK